MPRPLLRNRSLSRIGVSRRKIPMEPLPWGVALCSVVLVPCLSGVARQLSVRSWSALVQPGPSRNGVHSAAFGCLRFKPQARWPFARHLYYSLQASVTLILPAVKSAAPVKAGIFLRLFVRKCQGARFCAQSAIRCNGWPSKSVCRKTCAQKYAGSATSNRDGGS